MFLQNICFFFPIKNGLSSTQGSLSSGSGLTLHRWTILTSTELSEPATFLRSIWPLLASDPVQKWPGRGWEVRMVQLRSAVSSILFTAQVLNRLGLGEKELLPKVQTSRHTKILKQAEKTGTMFHWSICWCHWQFGVWNGQFPMASRRRIDPVNLEVLSSNKSTAEYSDEVLNRKVILSLRAWLKQPFKFGQLSDTMLVFSNGKIMEFADFQLIRGSAKYDGPLEAPPNLPQNFPPAGLRMDKLVWKQ